MSHLIDPQARRKVSHFIMVTGEPRACFPSVYAYHSYHKTPVFDVLAGEEVYVEVVATCDEVGMDEIGTECFVLPVSVLGGLRLEDAASAWERDHGHTASSKEDLPSV